MDGTKLTVKLNYRPKVPVRPESPSKQPPRIRATPSSSTSRAASAVGRTPRATPATTPDARPRVFPSSSPRASPTPGLHHAASVASFRSAAPPPRLLASRSVVGLGDRDRTPAASPAPRIRAKLSAVATSAAAASPASPHSPIAPSFATPPRSSSPTPLPRARAPSTVASPPPQFYPITTAAPAANPHRFAQARPAPSSSTNTPRTSPTVPHPAAFQSFRTPTALSPSSSPRPRAQTTAAAGPTARVDPAALALPLPHSPPASSVSVSSRSSASFLEPASPAARHAHSRNASTSSASRVGPATPATGETDSTHPTPSGAALRATLDNLMRYTSGLADAPDEPPADAAHDGERKVKAAAKSDRKIADLEITTRSLLAINATLEATAHRQAREIRTLRRRLRETRLGLPPRAFRAAAAADSDLGLSLDDDDDDLAALGADADEDDADTDDGDATLDSGGAGDAAYRRIRILLDALLADGRAALAREAPAPTKVLSPDEMRSYHADKAADGEPKVEADTGADEESDFSDTGDDEEASRLQTSEDEVEELVSRSSSPPPPIRITQPGEL